MSARNDGGPAFPVSMVGVDGSTSYDAVHGGGMTLRQYYAGQALTGLLAQPGMTIDIDGERLGEKRAGVCVAMADALIAELAKP